MHACANCYTGHELYSMVSVDDLSGDGMIKQFNTYKDERQSMTKVKMMYAMAITFVMLLLVSVHTTANNLQEIPTVVV